MKSFICLTMKSSPAPNMWPQVLLKHIICTIYYIEVIASLLTREVIFLLLGSLTLYFLNKALQRSHSVKYERYIETYVYFQDLSTIEQNRMIFHNKAFTLRSLIFDIGSTVLKGRDICPNWAPQNCSKTWPTQIAFHVHVHRVEEYKDQSSKHHSLKNWCHLGLPYTLLSI